MWAEWVSPEKDADALTEAAAKAQNSDSLPRMFGCTNTAAAAVRAPPAAMTERELAVGAALAATTARRPVERATRAADAVETAFVGASVAANG